MLSFNKTNDPMRAEKPKSLKRSFLNGFSLVGLLCVLGTLSPIVHAQQGQPPEKEPEAIETDQVVTETPAQPVQQHAYAQGILSDQDQATLKQIITSAKAKSFANAEQLRLSLEDPLARKIGLWAILNNDGGDIYGFAALDAARRDLWGWPREQKRQIAAEKLIATSGMTPSQIIEWFKGAPPQTTEGTMALIRAYNQKEDDASAQALAKSWWRNQPFDAATQERFYTSFSPYLEASDHQARLNTLLIGPQGASLALMLTLVDDKHRAIADAATALRSNRSGASDLYNATIKTYPNNPVLSFEAARYLHRHGLDTLAYPLLDHLPQAPENEAIGNSLWAERLYYFRSALKGRNYVAAYHAMNDAGFTKGEKKAESDFFAGWLALTKLNRPQEALSHFKGVKAAGTSPITQGRANYWIGRAYEALDDEDNALAAYREGSQYIYAFYGQLAAEKAGITTLKLGKEPVPSPADKSRFESRELVKAAKMLSTIDAQDQFRVFITQIGNSVPNAEEHALLYDFALLYDAQDTASRAARVAHQRGFYMPERAFPLRDVSSLKGPEPAFILAITRQESGFDPRVRSHANAKGMMQLIPPTARYVARKLSIAYDESKLYDPDYNMVLGASYLGEMVDNFGGSYVMAAAGYNAGPGRPAAWSQTYVDPRGDNGDPLGFIESAPFGETRDYMMRVTENIRVYRARLNGGQAPLTALADIRRGTVVAYSGSGELNANGPVSYNDLQKNPSGEVNSQALPDAAPAPLAPPAPTKPLPVSLSQGNEGVELPRVAPRPAPRVAQAATSQKKVCSKNKKKKLVCRTVVVKSKSATAKSAKAKASKSKATKGKSSKASKSVSAKKARKKKN